MKVPPEVNKSSRIYYFQGVRAYEGIPTTTYRSVPSGKIEEALIPLKEEVRGACELLGFDLLYLVNEGKLVAIVDPAVADDVLKAMRTHPLGREAAIIGAVQADPPGRVMMKLPTGATRVVDMPLAEPLPRIC